MKHFNFLKISIAIALLCCSLHSYSQTRLPAVISSNMVLQRNAKIPVWGWSAPGTKVSVAFAGQSVTAVAGPDSLWRVDLKALTASSSPRSMTIIAGNQQKKLDNILVGEVWICSGQSNMEYPMDRSIYNMAAPVNGADSAAIALKERHPGIRIMKVERKYSYPDVTSTGWSECEGPVFANSSAAGFFFAKHLQAELNVPVGIVTAAWSGSRIEPWIPPAEFARLPVFADDVKQNDSVIDHESEGKMYRSLIAPLAPFAIKGFLWYQGESNCINEDHDMRYAYKMQAMADSWRKLWGANLPLYYVLIAPYTYTDWKNMPHTPESLPKFLEQQIAAAQIPNTAFISVSDLVDNIQDIHPSYKWKVGRRLANLALAKSYHLKSGPYLYPTYDHEKVTGNQVTIYFKNANGLKTLDGKAPDFFEIAGADGKYLAAEAVIKGNSVVLSNTAISNPVNARFGWTQEARPNLVNEAGLPAIFFRTYAEKWNYQPLE